MSERTVNLKPGDSLKVNLASGSILNVSQDIYWVSVNTNKDQIVYHEDYCHTEKVWEQRCPELPGGDQMIEWIVTLNGFMRMAVWLPADADADEFFEGLRKLTKCQVCYGLGKN